MRSPETDIIFESSAEKTRISEPDTGKDFANCIHLHCIARRSRLVEIYLFLKNLSTINFRMKNEGRLVAREGDLSEIL